MRIETALARFTQQLQADGRSPHTINQYRRHVSLLARWAADVGHCGEIEALTHEDLAQFLASPLARTRPDGAEKKATAMNCLRSSLRAIFAHLDRAGYLPQDPARLIRRARCAARPPLCLSDAECQALMATLAGDKPPAARRDHALFDLLLESGIRLGSALALRTNDLDLDGGEILLRRTKGDHPERVVLSRRIVRHLRRYVKRLPGDVLFPGREGQPLGHRQAARRLAMWADRAGVQGAVHPHMLRHTFATRLYRKTHDVLLVKEALRHRSISSTLVYCRVDEARLRRAL